ncbi:MAG: hypothetical protein LBB10_03630, partial [Bifidobacteriaceae bacterium]|nr:hypothetical protein [Bifidobacteriaceae bacterium]
GKALHISAKELKKEKVQYVFVNTQSLSTKLFAGQSLFMTGKNNDYFISSELFTSVDAYTQKVKLEQK